MVPIWYAGDESNAATIDDQPWQDILDSYRQTSHPSSIHRFDRDWRLDRP